MAEPIVIHWRDDKGIMNELEIPDREFEINIARGMIKVKRLAYLDIVVQTSCPMDIDILDTQSIRVISNWNEGTEARKEIAKFHTL